MPAIQFSTRKVLDAVDEEMNRRFSPGKKLKYMLASELPYLTLDPRVFSERKLSEEEAENAVAAVLPAAFAEATSALPEGTPGRLPTRSVLRQAYTRLDMAQGRVPATVYGQLVLHSYSANGGWYVMVAPGMYEQTSATGTNHYTAYSYDRHVPLAFFGSAFVPGTYHQRTAPVDIAATFASLLRVNQPTASIGRVLVEAIRPEGSVSREGRSSREAAGSGPRHGR